ncbi:CPBP family intramembrane metalloprotease [Candidatus Peregrinibacteria bacterium]|nr:CPBP family intramembrane metalloprotease [Candidatus Peregrinibacteria bacterium]
MKKHFTTPWKGVETALILLETVILIVATLLVSHFLDLNKLLKTEAAKFSFIIISFFVLWLILITPLLIHTGYRYKLKISHFGFNKVSLKKTVLYAVLTYLLFHLLNLLIVIFMLYTDIKIPGYQTQKFLLPLIGDNNFYLLIIGFVTIIIGPIIEEIFFRGFILRSLGDKIGLFFASIISALLFALLHFQFEVFFPILILGLLINQLVIKTNSLYPAIAFHILNNAVVFTVEILILKNVIRIESFL